MAIPFIQVRSDVAANPASVRYRDIGGDFVQCRYGEALDGAEDCILTLTHRHAAIPDLSIRNVLRITNEWGQVREYRITRLEDSATDPLVTVRASPILHDLNSVILQQLQEGVWTDTFFKTISPRLWAQLVCDEMARRGADWWEVGTVDLDGTLTLSVEHESGLGLMRRIVEGTLANVFARRNGEAGYFLDLDVLLPVEKPRIIVGQNVDALVREIDSSSVQMTIAVMKGQETAGDSASQSVEEVPFVIDSSPSGSTVLVSDHDGSGASLAIEPDQFVGDAGIVYADKALVGLMPPPVALTITGDSGAELSRCHASVRIGDKLWVAMRRGTAVGQLFVVDIPTGDLDATYDLTVTAPTSIVYDGTRLFVAGAGEFDIVDPSDGSIDDTITLAGVYWLHWDATNSLIWTTCDAGIVLIDPADGSTDTTISNATVGATVTPSRLAEGDGAIWAMADDSGALSVVRCDVATKAWVSTTGIDADVIDDTDDYTRLAYDTVNDELWIGAEDTGDLAVLDLTPAVVTTIATAIHGIGGVLSLVSYAGEVFVGGTANRIACFIGRNAVGTSWVWQENVNGGADDDWSDNWMLSSLGDGWYAHGGTNTTHTDFYLRYWSATSHGGEHRREITAVDYTTGQVTFASSVLVPWRVGDPVWITNLDGSRFRTIWSPVAVNLYGHIERVIEVPDHRSERNLVRTPAPTVFDVDEHPVGWVVPTYANGNMEHRRRDADALTTFDHFIKVIAPTRTTGNWRSCTLYDMPGGFVCQPGDWVGQQDVVAERTEIAVVPGGSFSAYDDFAGTGQDLDSVAFPNPGTTGITGWEYTGASNTVTRQGYVSTVAGSANYKPIRVDVDLLDDRFGLTADVARFAVDTPGAAGGLCFWVKNTAIGSFDDFEYYRVVVVRNSSTDVTIQLEHIDDVGTLTTIGSSAGAYTCHIYLGGTPDGIRIRLEVDGTTCTVYKSDHATGANEVLAITATLPVDYRSAGHTRHGIVFSGNPSSGLIVPTHFGYTDLDNAPPPLGAATAVLCRSSSSSPINGNPGEEVHYRRPKPLLLADRDEWFVLQVPRSITSVDGPIEYTTDVYVGRKLRAAQTLRFALAGSWFGGPGVAVTATLTNFQASTPAATPILDIASEILPANVVEGELALIDIQADLPDDTPLGWYRLTVTLGPPVSDDGRGFTDGGTMIDLRASVFWGTEGAVAFGRSNGGGWLWQAGLNALTERSSPLVHYSVTPREDNSALLFALGARCELRDAERNLTASTPRIVAIRRYLPSGAADPQYDPPQPEIELDNRSLDLIRQLVNKGSL